MQGSILDRLIDQADSSREPVQYRRLSYNQVRAAVGRDLENLLNTKNFNGSLPDEYMGLKNSLYGYGLPDFTSASPRDSSVRFQLRQEVEKAISLFEPRLRNVTVRLEDSDGDERNLRFKISALLVMDPVAEPVSFDTLFDVNRCEYSISK